MAKVKVLLNHGTPRALRKRLTEANVTTAGDKRWDAIANGLLLSKAEQAGYTVMVTTNQVLLHQTEDDDRHPFERLAAVHRQIGDEIADLRKLARLPNSRQGGR